MGKVAQIAAGIVCAVFGAFILIHLVWAAGSTWGLAFVSGDDNTEAGIPLTLVSLAAAAVAVMVIIVTAGRVGWLKTPFSDRMLHIGAWFVFLWPAIGSLNPLTTWGQRIVTVPLALAALVVATSHPRQQAVRTRPLQHHLGR
jgi:hypothetical protein